MLNKILLYILPYIPESLIWIFAKSYIAGKEMMDAIKVSQELNKKNISVTIDFIGEFITQLKEAEPNIVEYISLIKTLKKYNIRGGISIKPSMFGLLLDEKQCYINVKKIVKTAAELDVFVRLDMEDSKCVDLEIELYKKLLFEFPNNIGLVFQAYLKRTFNDIQNLIKSIPKNQRLNIRLCKGIYIESPEVSYKKYEEINEHYLENLQLLLKDNIFTAVASHDDFIINRSKRILKTMKTPDTQYEYQMLYGVRNELRDQLASENYKIRVYIPYGTQWKSYSIRRFKENPQFLSFMMKQLIK